VADTPTCLQNRPGRFDLPGLLVSFKHRRSSDTVPSAPLVFSHFRPRIVAANSFQSRWPALRRRQDSSYHCLPILSRCLSPVAHLSAISKATVFSREFSRLPAARFSLLRQAVVGTFVSRSPNVLGAGKGLNVIVMRHEIHAWLSYNLRATCHAVDDTGRKKAWLNFQSGGNGWAGNGGPKSSARRAVDGFIARNLTPHPSIGGCVVNLWFM